MRMKSIGNCLKYTLLTSVSIFLVIFLSCKSGPEIHIWYGQNQTFGKPALAQKWINILGHVSASEEDSVFVYYSLNGRPGGQLEGTPGMLNIGPHPSERLPRRLMFSGDFNIEIDEGGLLAGTNEVSLVARDAAGNSSEKTIVFEYQRGISCMLPYTVDWHQVDNALGVLQIVDGLWIWNQDGIRTRKIGYDRVLAIGDMSWTDYEAKVLVTFHGVADTTNYPGSIRDGVGFGLSARWLGHSDDPIPGQQPKWGWKPSGASAWYVFRQARGQEKFGNGILQLDADPQEGDRKIDDTLDIEFGRSYWFKVRALTQNVGSRYDFKAWDASQPEPESYMLATNGLEGNLAHGSLIVVAHYVDVTIGPIVIDPIKDTEYITTVPTLSKMATHKLLK